MLYVDGFCTVQHNLLLHNGVLLLVFAGKREESLNKYNSALNELPSTKWVYTRTHKNHCVLSYFDPTFIY